MRIKNDGFDNEYIKGYENLTFEGVKDDGWKDKWKNIGKKEVATKENLPSGKMYTHADNLFKYSKDLGEWDNFNSGDYEDPTYLGFSLMFDDFNSPLWNYGNYSSNNPNIEPLPQTPGYFLSKYDNIPELMNRKILYLEFLKNLNDIFARYGDDSSISLNVFNGVSISTKNQRKKQHYIELITGLDKLNDKMVKYPDNKLTIQMTEDISLRTTYLAELYNNLIYSYKNQRNLIPENLLRFDLVIEISDVRVFRKLSKYTEEITPNVDTGEKTNKGLKGLTEKFNKAKDKVKSFGDKKTDPITEQNGIISETNTDPARIIYTLHDCNFDFSNTSPFDAGIQMAGLGFKLGFNPTVTTFDIKYKSVSKEIKTTLIKDSLRISNKIFDVATKATSVSCNIEKNSKMQSDKSNFFNCKIIFGSDSTLTPVETDPSFMKKLGILAAPYLSNTKDQLMNKFHEMRGELINKTIENLRNKLTFIPKIYPDNVYSTDFRKLSIKNFAKDIGSKMANDAAKGLTNGINGVLGF